MINYIIQHNVEIMAIIGIVLTLANMIARLTPTQEDDKVVEKVRKVFEQISNLCLPNVKK